jgi:cyclase
MSRVIRQKLEEIDDGIFAYLQLDGSWCLNNSGIVLGREGTIVVDTAATETRARKLHETVRRLGSGRSTTLVNTHHHGDHCFGNSIFAPETTIIAHELARVEMAEAGTGLRGIWPDVEWGELELRLPDVTFPDRMTIHAGDFEVQLIHVGPAHTTNDVVAWLPGQRVLFAGDVVFNGVTPFVLMGSVAGSLSAVEKLRALGPTTIVPGHGAVGGAALLDHTADYLLWVQHLATEGIAVGLSPAEAAREADLAQYAELLDGERIVGNLIRAYAEARDGDWRPVDIADALRQMFEHRGGRPDCFA